MKINLVYGDINIPDYVIQSISRTYHSKEMSDLKRDNPKFKLTPKDSAKKDDFKNLLDKEMDLVKKR